MWFGEHLLWLSGFIPCRWRTIRPEQFLILPPYVQQDLHPATFEIRKAIPLIHSFDILAAEQAAPTARNRDGELVTGCLWWTTRET